MEVRAHVEDDANFAMPESAHTGGGHHTRATPGGCAGVAAIGYRVASHRAARVRGRAARRRQGWAHLPDLCDLNRFRQGALSSSLRGSSANTLIVKALFRRCQKY